MRKLFSLFAAVLFAGSMMAQVTITPGDFTETTSADFSTVKEGVTVAVTASTVTADQIRIFKGQTITISAESNITSIVFTCTANGTAKYGPGCFAAQDGYTFDAEGPTGTWTGSATSVTFTSSTNQVRATQIVVTLAGGDVPPTPQPTDETVVYNWSTVEADQVGATVLGAGGKTTVSSTKIHGNQDPIDAVKFEKSYVYADGHYMAIKPAEGAFKAGDSIVFSAVINNSGARTEKYAMVQFYAADGATRLFQGDTVVNGQLMTDDPIVESFKLEADQDSLLLGRYGSTNMFVTMLKVVRPAGEVVPPTPEDTWTVAGSSDVAFGTTWAPANEANDMVKQEDGSYKWEKADLVLAAGTIEFKVVKNHAWAEAYPAQNYELNIAEAGIYTITITFEPANENTVSAVATKTGEAVVIPTVAMHGNFLGSWADTENFTLADNKETATLALTIAEGNYEFGMRIGGSGNWMSNGSAFTRENNSFVIAAGSGNLTLAADLAGEYIFTWTFETNTLTITYPAVAPVVTTYEVAEAIAAGLTDDTEIQVRGIITKMEFKGKNFAKYGSVNIYVADATGAEGEFEFYNCYSLNADTFKTSTPAYDAESTAWAEFEEVVDANGVAIHVGDTVIAFGKYTLYNNTVYELKQGCYLVDIKEGEGGQEETIGYDYEPTTVSTFDVTIASVSVKDLVADYGVITFELEDADGAYFAYLELISSTSEPATGIYPINFTEQDGTFYASPGGDDQYDYGCYFGVMDGEYYNPYYMVSGSVEIAEDGMTVNATSYNGSTIKLTYKAPEEAIDNTEVKASAVKFLQNDQLIIEKNGVRYNVNGQQIR